MTLEIAIAVGAAGLVLFTGITFIMCSVTRSELLELRHANELSHKDFVYQSRERFDKVERDLLDNRHKTTDQGYEITTLQTTVNYLDQEVKKLDNRIDGECY